MHARLRALFPVKSYQSTAPPGLSQRHIASARRCWKASSSSEEKTVETNTMSCEAAGTSASSASPSITFSAAGSTWRACAQRSGNSSMAVRCSAVKPMRNSSNRLPPPPQPTSSRRSVERSSIPACANSRSIARCRSCTDCQTAGLSMR